MRGELKITAAKAPFRRGGLSFHAGHPTIVHLGDLDGQRLLALLTEPRLTVFADRGDGFEAMPAIDAETSVDDLQQLIDHYAADRPVPVAAVPLDPEALAARVAELETSLEGSAADLASTREALGEMEAIADQARSDLLAAQGKRDAATAELEKFKAGATRPAAKKAGASSAE